MLTPSQHKEGSVKTIKRIATATVNKTRNEKGEAERIIMNERVVTAYMYLVELYELTQLLSDAR